MKNSKVLASLVACALALSLGLTACGGSSTDTAASSTEEAEVTTEETSATAEDTTEATTEADAAESDTWKDVYKGKNDDFELYYAESPDGTEAILLAYAPSTKTYAFYDGKTSTDSDGVVTLTDQESGAVIAYQVTAVSDDGNTMTLATSEFGEFEIEMTTIEDFSADVATITETGAALDLAELTE